MTDERDFLNHSHIQRVVYSITPNISLLEISVTAKINDRDILAWLMTMNFPAY
jgi:hypothetical protein